MTNAIKGSITRRIIMDSSNPGLKLSINDVTVTIIVNSKTSPSRILRILCLYGLMNSCIKAMRVLVTAINTWVVLLLVELMTMIEIITSQQII